MDNWHKVAFQMCDCELCQPQWICPICEEKCVNREHFDWHFQWCDKELRKEKE